jgi:hypothetical protein
MCRLRRLLSFLLTLGRVGWVMDGSQINYLAALPVEHKALIFCSMFLIDMVYFEVRDQNGSQGGLLGAALASSQQDF